MKNKAFLSFAQLSPIIRYVNDVKSAPNSHIPSRMIYDHEIIFVASGSGQVQIDRDVYKVHQDNLIFLRPAINNWWKADPVDPYQILCIHFDFYPHIRSDNSNNFSYPVYGLEDTRLPTITLIDNGDQYMMNHFSLLEEFSKNRPLRNLNMQSIFMQMLIQIYRELNTNSNTDNMGSKRKQISPILRYIDSNFARSLKSRDLAWMAGFHPTYFCRVFQEVTGQTPLEYLTDIRMRHAKQLLLYSDRNIEEIAIKVGYASLHYFSRLFKKHEGVSPTGFIKQYSHNVKNRNQLSKFME